MAEQFLANTRFEVSAAAVPSSAAVRIANHNDYRMPGKAPTVSEPTTESISSAAVRMTIAGNGAAIDDNRPDPCPRQAPAIRGLRRGFIAHGPCQRVDSGSLGPTAPARRTPIAMVCRAIESVARDHGLTHIGRLTANLLRPLPIAEIEIEVITDYSGRNAAHYSARLWGEC